MGGAPVIGLYGVLPVTVTGVVVVTACFFLVAAGGVLTFVARRVLRLVGVLVLGAAVILATNWWMHGAAVGK